MEGAERGGLKPSGSPLQLSARRCSGKLRPGVRLRDRVIRAIARLHVCDCGPVGGRPRSPRVLLAQYSRLRVKNDTVRI